MHYHHLSMISGIDYMKRATNFFTPRRLSPLSFNEVYTRILHHVRHRKKLLLFTMNIHSLRLIYESPKTRKAFVQADILFPDGVGLLWLSYFMKRPLRGRVSGTDLVEKLLKTQGLRIFLLGSTSAVLKKLSETYTTIVGVYSPDRPTDPQIRKTIEATKSGVLLVAFGQPEQELWLTQNMDKLSCTIGVGVGSAFDILSGKVSRAPKLLRDRGLEWLWRIIFEPKRLALRYAKDVMFLLKLLFRAIHI